MSEFTIVDNDTIVSLTEYAVVDTSGGQSTVGLGTLGATRSGNVRAGSYNALKDNAEIEDFRSMFY